ncbi:MAG: Beta-1,4-mannooligosaccharide phosphorylase [Microgenomates bacterium OLB23]|nr:MAG: Beta-1,4-mannooligosaccharide phosphorylase [Microgenomates bacterium OLB23]
MIKLQRDRHNPLLAPNPANIWESYAAFNGAVVKDENGYHMVYRAVSNNQKVGSTILQLSTIGYAKSHDGSIFDEHTQLIAPKEKWETYGCEDPRITKIDDMYVIFYTALSGFPFSHENIKVAVALSKDLKSIDARHLVTPFNAKAMTLFPRKINDKYVVLFTYHTDQQPSYIVKAECTSLSDLWSEAFWEDWEAHWEDHIIPLKRLNRDFIEVGATPIETDKGWVFFYSYVRNYYIGEPRQFTIEAVLLDKDNPGTIIGRINEPLLVPEEEYEKEGMVSDIVFPSGAIKDGEAFHVYYGGADTVVGRASIHADILMQQFVDKPSLTPRLKRYEENPIMEPHKEHTWEALAVFNPAALYMQNKIHIIYRAMSLDNTSTMGYAASDDGFNLTYRSIQPIYMPRFGFEDKRIPGGNSGCEDGRLTLIDGRVYVTYTAYNGVDVPRVALSSIAAEDFAAGKWNWSEAHLISPPGVDDKDACIFPEKIHDKYVVFHRIDGIIVIDYVDSLDFDGTTWLRTLEYINITEEVWHGLKIGIAGPPIKTNEGWLLLYHAISSVDKNYRLGAMLLELDKPAVIKALLPYPILEPERDYETQGIVNNVVFPCGAVDKNGTLFVYYGGADRVIGVATIEMQTLLHALLLYKR